MITLLVITMFKKMKKFFVNSIVASIVGVARTATAKPAYPLRILTIGVFISSGIIATESAIAASLKKVTNNSEQTQNIDSNSPKLLAVTPRDQALIDQYLSTAIPFPGRSDFFKIGTFQNATGDLETFFANPTGRPIEERVPGQLFIVRLDEQVTIVVRNFSSDGFVTLEIQDKSSGRTVNIAKVRYLLTNPF